MLPVEAYARSRARAASSYPLSFSALGMTGAGGIVFDSIESSILQSTGGSAAGNGDVIGDVQSVSGTAATITQGTGANKPTNTVTNGVGAITFGDSLYLAGAMDTAFEASSFSAVIVQYNPGTLGSFYPFVFDGEGLDYLICENANLQYRLDNTPIIQFTDGGSAARIIRIRSTVSASLMETYSLAGVQQVTLGGAGASSPMGTSFKIGYPTTQKAGEVAFLMLTDYDIDDTLFNTIKAQLVTRFGGWR